jgi:hypothetical protein
MSGSNLPTTGPIDDAYVVDPDCRDGKHASCVGGACECWCHRKLGGLLGADVRSAWRLRDAAISALGRSQLRRADYERFERAMAEFDQAMASAARALGARIGEDLGPVPVILMAEPPAYLTVWQPADGTFRMFEERLDGSCVEVRMQSWP